MREGAYFLRNMCAMCKSKKSEYGATPLHLHSFAHYGLELRKVNRRTRESSKNYGLAHFTGAAQPSGNVLNQHLSQTNVIDTEDPPMGTSETSTEAGPTIGRI